MQPTEQGRICSACQKKVIDFTKKSWKQIEEIQNANNNSLCGVYTQEQLKHWGYELNNLRNNRFKKITILTSAILTTTLTFYSKNVLSQPTVYEQNENEAINKNDSINNKLPDFIEGTVFIKNTNDPVAFISIGFKKNLLYDRTDSQGKFKIDLRSISNFSSDTLEIKAEGFVTKQIITNKKSLIQKGGYFNIELEHQIIEMPTRISSYYAIKAPSRLEKIKWKVVNLFKRKKK